jgi:zinc transport system substrate-binding protein
MIKKLIIVLLVIFGIRALHAQPRYVTTIHPFQQILQEVVGNRGTVEAIVPPGASPHTYEIRPSNMRTAANALALFYGAKDLDAWATRIPVANRIELFALVPDSLKLELNLEGTHKAHHDHVHTTGIDPHFWPDPLVIKAMLPELVTVLSQLDPAGAAIYSKNAAIFAGKLDEIYARIAQQLASVRGTTAMLSHPFFCYFFHRFQIPLVDEIEKIPGKEPTPRELKALIDVIQEHQVKAIFNHAQLPDRAARVIAEASGVPVVELDPLGGRPGRMTYFELLQFNANILLEALK